MSKTKTQTTWSFASLALHDAYTDFILSRRAMDCSLFTMSFYRFTAGKFLESIKHQAVS